MASLPYLDKRPGGLYYGRFQHTYFTIQFLHIVSELFLGGDKSRIVNFLVSL